MTSEKNGRQIMKAFLNNQGNSNDDRPNYYATFDEGDDLKTMNIFFQSPQTMLTQFKAQFYADVPNISVILVFNDGTNIEQMV